MELSCKKGIRSGKAAMGTIWAAAKDFKVDEKLVLTHEDCNGFLSAIARGMLAAVIPTSACFGLRITAVLKSERHIRGKLKTGAVAAFQMKAAGCRDHCGIIS